MSIPDNEQRNSLGRFLEPLLPLFGRSERRHWSVFYIRGLLLEGRRKTAAGLARQYDGNEQAIQQFVSDSPWQWMPVRRELALRMTKQVNNGDIGWIIDETCFPKQGEHSVDVARQYCGTLGKAANSQSAVSLNFAVDEVAFPLDFELYMPNEWSDDKDRREQAGIPDDLKFKRHWEIALEIIDTAISWQIPKGVVIADTAYGEVGDFRVALFERGLSYALAVGKKLSVWLEAVDLSRPIHIKQIPKPKRLLEVAKGLPNNRWKSVTWREGSKGPLTSRFARVRVQPAHSGRIWSASEPMQWLLIEWPEGAPEPTNYYLLNLPEKAKLKELVCWARRRWPVEQNYRELKDELGLDHFEGRSYVGWHHHVTLTMMAFNFLIQQRLDQLKKGEVGLCRRQEEKCSIC